MQDDDLNAELDLMDSDDALDALDEDALDKDAGRTLFTDPPVAPRSPCTRHAASLYDLMHLFDLQLFLDASKTLLYQDAEIIRKGSLGRERRLLSCASM